MADRQFDLGEIKAHLEGPTSKPQTYIGEVGERRRASDWFDELKAVIDDYVVHGTNPDEFLRAVIENDLEGVLELPLEEDVRPLVTPGESRPPIQVILEIMHYVRDNVPEHAQGKPGMVANWMKLSEAAREQSKRECRGLDIMQMTMPAFPQHVGDTFSRMPEEQKAMVAAQAIRDIHALVSSHHLAAQVFHQLEDVRDEVAKAVEKISGV